MPERHASAARAQTAPADPAPLPGLVPPEPRISVLIPLPLAGAYDYLAPDDPPLRPGAVVRVPLGGREVLGVVWDRDSEAEGEAEAVPVERLKWVQAVYDTPPIPEVQRRFIDWVAGYTLAPPGAVLRMALSVPKALDPPRPLTGYRLAPGAGEILTGIRQTPARNKIAAVLADSPARPLTELARAAGVGVSVIKGLAKAGVLEAVELPPPAAFEAPRPEGAGPILSPDQDAAAAALRAAQVAPCFEVTLLDGVTGSGKTEVYLEAVAAALEGGRQVLVLLPEIALSAQWLERFTERFGAAPAVWHSELTARARRATWRAVASGEARVVVGARSALFLPFSELGLIVIDEEHDAAFKQEDGVIYHARDMAVVRARLGQIPIVLVSATPSLETVTNVKAGRYRCLHLPDRHGGARLPEVTLVDLRRDKPERIESLGQGWLSPSLRQAIVETLAAEEQVLLFLNRRGYAPLTLCRACGHRLECPHCTAWLVEHRLAGRLQCHHCGFESRLPERCPACEAEGALAACGPGVERLAEEVAALYPQARTAVMASDTLAGPSAAAELLRAVAAREVDLLIGTQIVAKGHHFPHLTLVGVVDADLGLYGGDLRAAERTYQLLHQVAGRAGRAARPGRVLIQTAEPEHPVMQALASGARDRFIEIETEARQHAGMPPFGRLVALILSGPDPVALERAARALARAAPRYEGVQVLGPAPAPLAVLRGRHRRRFLLKARREVAVQQLVRDWVAQVKLTGKLRLQIDIDPYSFL
jgi:primosomal protein N' (replication factor Y)